MARVMLDNRSWGERVVHCTLQGMAWSGGYRCTNCGVLFLSCAALLRGSQATPYYADYNHDVDDYERGGSST